jgi:hypothetical protein
MEFEPIKGQPVRFPPGKVAIKLDATRLMDYRRLYARSGTDLAGLPKLRDRDFDGRRVYITRDELDALNAALARLHAPRRRATGSVFEGQQQHNNRLFKRLQYLS